MGIGAMLMHRSTKLPGSVRLAQIQLKAWHPTFIEETADEVLRAAKMMGVQASGIIRLPTKRTLYSVLRSPFVHKKHWDQVRMLPLPEGWGGVGWGWVG